MAHIFKTTEQTLFDIEQIKFYNKGCSRRFYEKCPDKVEYGFYMAFSTDRNDGRGGHGCEGLSNAFVCVGHTDRGIKCIFPRIYKTEENSYILGVDQTKEVYSSTFKEVSPSYIYAIYEIVPQGNPNSEKYLQHCSEPID